MFAPRETNFSIGKETSTCVVKLRERDGRSRFSHVEVWFGFQTFLAFLTQTPPLHSFSTQSLKVFD